MILGTTNPALWDEIGFTADIEDGIGPVKIGTPVTYLDPEGATWYLVCHPFAEVDGAWLEAYTSGDNPPVVILGDTIPEGFVPAEPAEV